MYMYIDLYDIVHENLEIAKNHIMGRQGTINGSISMTWSGLA